MVSCNNDVIVEVAGDAIEALKDQELMRAVVYRAHQRHDQRCHDCVNPNEVSF